MKLPCGPIFRWSHCLVSEMVQRSTTRLRQLRSIYVVSTTLSLKMWTAAYQWAGLIKKVHEKPHPTNCRLLYISPSTMKRPFTETYLSKVLDATLHWSSFDEYRLFSTTVWVIQQTCFGLKNSAQFRGRVS